MKHNQFTVRNWSFPEVATPHRVTEIRVQSDKTSVELIGDTCSVVRKLEDLKDLALAILEALAQLETWALVASVYPEEHP